MCAKATSQATPEQLREAIKALFDRADTAKVCNIDGFTEETLALFATFLASIELPEKPVRPHAADSPIAYGFKMAIDQSQAIIDKLGEELRHGQ